MTAATRTVRVIDGGLLTTIQDAGGRPGLGGQGVPVGGAMDPAAARLADRLVGGRGAAAVLEITTVGPTLAFDGPAHVAIAGADLGAASGHVRLVPGASVRLPAGAMLRFEGALAPGGGFRAYLAVQGGFLVPPVLGSVATDRRSGFGGLEGRELRPGDVLHYPADQAGPLRSVVGPAADAAPGRDLGAAIRVVPVEAGLGWSGPEALAALLETRWIVAADADRSGIRLVGGTVPMQATRIASLGMPLGAIQVPPSGEPIITMVDGPVTGGYPVVAVVAAVDLGRIGQVGPGAPIRFAAIEVDAARALAAAVLAAGEPRLEIDAGDLAADWAR